MPCNCIGAMDEALAEYNTRILLPLMLDGSTAKPLIETERIETGRGKKKAVKVFASYCPFCGVKLDQACPLPNTFENAAKHIVETGSASTKELQRRLNIGFNAAARYIERLQTDGILSLPDEQGKCRIIAIGRLKAFAERQ